MERTFGNGFAPPDLSSRNIQRTRAERRVSACSGVKRCLRLSRDERSSLMRTVGVVIPYFQRERGLLRRSVDSVIAQELPSNVRLNVVIVDDSSPWPARDELAEHPLLIRSELTIIKQPNGGPGAARNAALDFMSSEEIEYVAFLDSDDAWYPLHIATALEYLQGCDLYFDNTWEDERDFFSYS